MQTSRHLLERRNLRERVMMGCFSDCLRSRKHRNFRRTANRIPSLDQIPGTNEAPQAISSPNQESAKTPINPINESKVEVEEKSNSSNPKKVTFDLNVKAKSKLSNPKKVTFDLNVKPCEEESCSQEISNDSVEKEEKEAPNETQFFLSLISSPKPCHPHNYRYQNCPNTDDDEYEGLELGETDFDDELGQTDQKSIPDETSESLFSISIDSCRPQLHSADLDDKEVNSPVPKPNPSLSLRKLPDIGSVEIGHKWSESVPTVLNPVENLIQWKAARAGNNPPLRNQSKENMSLHKEDLKPLVRGSKLSDGGFAVDTSLSSWLGNCGSKASGESGSVSVGRAKAASASPEDRPILGALTVEEMKYISTSSSPIRRSPKRSPDDTPIIGTVGSYWSHTGQGLDSDSGSSSFKAASDSSTKYREDQRVKWNSTPFEKRLESAMKSGVAEF